MSGPLQFLNHSDPGRPTTGQSKGLHEAKSSKVKHLSAHTSQKNSPVACFDPPVVIPTKNPMMYNKRAADPVRPDLTGLLVKNKNLLAELRNLQNKLLIKETSLQEMKNELESYKENNVQQSFQIMSLKDDIKDLEELIASLTRIKSLKNTNIQNLERGNWDLTERIKELENRLRVHLFEREKAERKAGLLEKTLAGTDGFTPYMNMKGQEDSLDNFWCGLLPAADNVWVLGSEYIFHSEGPKDGQKIWDKYQQDSIHKEKQKSELDRPSHSFSWETKTARSHYQKFLSQLATLLSNSMVLIPATEEAVKERIQEIGAKERSWKSRTEDLQQEILTLTRRLELLQRHSEESRSGMLVWNTTLKHNFFISILLISAKENSGTKNSWTDEHGKMSKQLEKENEQQTLLNIQQNLQITTTQKLEEKIQKLQKQLSDLKLSNKSMKIQLTKVNVLKDKTIEKLRQSLTQVEAMRGKAVMKTDNLKTALDCAKQEARGDKEKVHQLLDAGARAAPGLQGQHLESSKLSGFRETIMKMLGFNMRTADKEIINHLRLIIQDYEVSNKSKVASDCETGQDNE
uniref:Coiled-coil domain-containing protein 170-like n=1 Tax=Ursus maritimus TaxID=29073 RepID=A0A452UCA9_URSMA